MLPNQLQAQLLASIAIMFRERSQPKPGAERLVGSN
jgi:hypothetical protein